MVVWFIGSRLHPRFLRMGNAITDAIYNLRMFRQNMAFTWVLLQFVTVNTIFYSIFFGMPTYLQEVRQFSPQNTGLIMLCVAGFGVIDGAQLGLCVIWMSWRLPKKCDTRDDTIARLHAWDGFITVHPRILACDWTSEVHSQLVPFALTTCLDCLLN